MKQNEKKKRGSPHNRRRKRALGGALLSVLLVLSMILSMMVLQGPEEVYAAGQSADPDTRTEYTSSLGNSSSTRYNGRVWTDKSVNTGDVTFTGDLGGNGITVEKGEDEDFLVTYSALATSTQVSGESQVPVDVVFVIDLSGSMSNQNSGMSDGRSRIANLVDALNASVEELMAMNPNTRIGVVGYSSDAQTILSLDHYTKTEDWWGQEQDFFSLNRETPNRNYAELTVHAKTSSGREIEETFDVEGGTNVQTGVYQGMNMLAAATPTTIEIDGEEVQRVPSVILLSDGAATYSSGSSSWWSPANNHDQGPGSDSYYGNGMKAMMTASYMKQAIDRHYNVSDERYKTTVYTIGIGTSQLSGSDKNLADITLNPKDHWNDNNTMANNIRQKWEETWTTGIWQTTHYGYTRQDRNGDYGTPEIDVSRNNTYTLTHPSQYDIIDIGLQYNDAYYDATTATDVTDVFEDIVSSISLSAPQAPTHIAGNNPVESGYITYTDPIGEYMQVDDVKTLIWAGQEFTNPEKSVSGNTTTYTFRGEIDSPAYDIHNVSEIHIQVSAGDDGKQTLTVEIPASAIPLRVNTITLNSEGGVESNVSNGAYPLRLIYSVSLQDDIDKDTLEGVSDTYIAANTVTDNTGKKVVNFYSNLYSGEKQGDTTVGDATVNFTPASTNPFYFIQENTPIYMDENGQSQVQEFDPSSSYYLPITYYEGNNQVTTYVLRQASTMAGYVESDGDGCYIRKGAPRLGNLQQFTANKGSNSTNTAESRYYPTFEGTDPANGQFVIYLGNNGLLQMDAPASLTIEKQVTAGEGLTAPDAEFSFTVTAEAKAGQNIMAVLYTPASGGGAATETEYSLAFDDEGQADFTLKAGQALEIPGMDSTEYSVTENTLPDGFSLTSATIDQQGAGTFDPDTDTVAGTLGSEDTRISFTNQYTVEPVTSTELQLPFEGSKSITGRDFQTGDSFEFTISAAQATPDAPLPMKDGEVVNGVTITPASGNSADFNFDGEITFTKPGEYRYIIQEAPGSLPGVDYDSVIYRISLVIKDKGDGTLALAEADEIQDAIGGLTYTSNPLIQKYVNGNMEEADQIAFQNIYSATDASISLNGVKDFQVTNSDRSLEDNQFTFKVEALGSNTDGSDNFTEDNRQPMPENLEAGNIANGNVSFGSMTFTQDMIGKTYGYKITEKLPEGVDAQNPTQNGITYDIAEKIVKVTVSRSAEGGLEHVVATVSPNENGVNFVFENAYEPGPVVISDNTSDSIQVQKTFTGRPWTEDDVFSYSIASTSAPADVTAPMPESSVISIGKPAEGQMNRATFGDMTFNQAGTYVYQITETPGDLKGVSYDSHVGTVTVTVTEDRTTGTLSAAVSYDNTQANTDSDKAVTTAAAFTNTYTSVFDSDTAVTLNGTKHLTVGGNSSETLDEDKFFFRVTPLDNAPTGSASVDPGASSYLIGNSQGTGQDGSYTADIANLLNQITYTQENMGGEMTKDFVYIITEQIPQPQAPGMDYDNTAYQVTVTVTDDGQGTLSAAAPSIEKGTWDGQSFTPAEQPQTDAVVFSNTYSPANAVIMPLEITKELLGDRNTPLAEGEFTFEISVASANPADGVQLPETTEISNDQNGKAQFGNITFTKAGTYVIQVKEQIPENATDNGDGTYILDGVTYDTHAVSSTFTVTDRSGQLTAVRSNTTGNQTFTNQYSATGVSAELEGTKTITGRAYQEGDSFIFRISGAYTGSVQDVTIPLPADVTADEENLASGTVTIRPNTGNSAEISFGTITFAKPGTYTYTISETDTGIDGVSKDNRVYTVSYTVTDQGDGTLQVSSPAYMLTGENPTEVQSLEWENRYSPDSVTVIGAVELTGTKTLTGRNSLENENYQFTLSAGDTATEEAIAKGSITMGTAESQVNGLEDGVQKNFSFGDITFREAGTYTFQVTENAPADGNGMTYDRHTGLITIVVTDNTAAGKLEAEVTHGTDQTGQGGENQSTDFVNQYEPIPVTYGLDTLLGGHKYMVDDTGHYSFADGQFTFYMRAQDEENPLPQGDGVTEIVMDGRLPAVSVTNTNTQGNQAEYDFGELTFTGPGTYVYNIFEETSNLQAGVSGDETTYTVTFRVTEDQATGQLSVEASAVELEPGDTENIPADMSMLDFTNTYNADEITGRQNILKQLQGRNFQAGDSFTFDVNVTAVDEQGQPMDYDDIPQPDGLDAGGQLTQVTPNDNRDGYSYSITITPSSTASGNTYRFNTGTYTYTHTGTYTFVVKEQAGQDGHITYDTQEYTIVVAITVDDSTGTPVLKREVTINGEPVSAAGGIGTIDFVNVYTPDGITLSEDTDTAIQVQKTLTGRDWLEEDTFTFTIAAVTPGAPMPDEASVTIDQQQGTQDGTSVRMPFGDITFTKADMGNLMEKDFVYTITETKGSAGGLTYDSHVAVATVHVTDDTAAGKLTASIGYTNADAPSQADREATDVAAFTNSYQTGSTELSGSANLMVTKHLTGRDWTGEDSFTFTLAGGDEATLGDIADGKIILPDNADGLIISGNTAGHAASFGDIIFTQEGTYTFLVTEQPSGIKGITDDAQSQRSLQVTVTDQLDGTLKAEINSGSSQSLVFTNTYNPESVTLGGDSAIQVQKTVAGKNWDKDDEAYTFTIQNVSKPDEAQEAPMPQQDTVTVGKPGQGNINRAAFGDMTFSVRGDYVYEITETEESIAGITYDKHVAFVRVTIAENQLEGKLEAHVSYDNSQALTADDQAVTDASAFTNVYKAEGTLELKGTKNITGRDFRQGDSFTFDVVAADNGPMLDKASQGKVTITPDAGQSTEIDFGTITFTEAGEYVYYLTEELGTLPGVIYDTVQRSVIVTVVDDGEGNLEAEITAGADTLIWNNSWEETIDVSFNLTGTKNLEGAELKDSQFTFLVEAQDNAPMGGSLPAAFNGQGADEDHDGIYTGEIPLLREVRYTSAGDYIYLIREVNDGQGGIQYDTAQYRITVHVAQNGSLSYTVEKAEQGGVFTETPDKAVVFTNRYGQPQEAVLNGSANLQGTKTLSGRDWTDSDRFTFVLEPGDEITREAISKNMIVMPGETEITLNGNYADQEQVPFAFGDITFKAEGTYTFKMTEKKPEEGQEISGITYSTNQRVVTVTVTDNKRGQLEAAVTEASGDTNFTNVYDTESVTLPGQENLMVKKMISGRDWKDGDSFTFTLAAGDEVTQKAVEDGWITLPENAAGITIRYQKEAAQDSYQAAFGDISFTREGNYVFHITEQGENHSGLTYDKEVRVVEVNVQDNLDGVLTAEAGVISPAEGLTFTNTYKPEGEVVVEPTDKDFQLTKILEGKDWEDDSFTFRLTPQGGKAADGALIPAEQIPMPQETVVTVDKSSGQDQEGRNMAVFSFGPITYTQAGTYVYEVAEEAGENAGISYDGHKATVTVAVTDNLNGGYTASVNVAAPVFTNVYDTSLDYVNKGGLQIIKKLTGHDMAAGQFAFTVVPQDDASAEKAGIALEGQTVEVNQDAAMNQEGTAEAVLPAFGQMSFTQQDDGAVYTYTVSESKGGQDGYVNDDRVYTVEIQVSDDGKGTLQAVTHVTSSKGEETFYTYRNTEEAQDIPAVLFENSYSAQGELGGSGDVSIQASKELTGRPQTAGEFRFTVTDRNGSQVSQGTNGADGSIAFSGISYTTEKLLADVKAGAAQYSKREGKDTFTYLYTVEESQEGLGEGVSQQTAAFQITVTVTDNSDGTLNIAVTYPEGSDSLIFKNVYGASAEASIHVAGSKKLAVKSGNNPPDITGKYTFEISGSEGAPMPEKTTAVNDEAGNVTFGDIVYTMENVFGEAVSQDMETESSNNQTEGTETKGQNQAEVTAGEGTEEIDNTKGDQTGTPESADKNQDEDSASAADTAQGSAQSAVLEKEKDQQMENLGAADSRTGESAGGQTDSISQSSEKAAAIEATKAQTGNQATEKLSAKRSKIFTYTVTESGSVPGVTNDAEASRSFTVTVTDNGDGTLSAACSQTPGAQFTFTNTYTVTPLEPTSPTDGAVTIHKELTGRDLNAEEFRFVMTDKDGQTVAESKNAGDGTVRFSGIAFDAPGTYSYQIKEIAGDLGGITYDGTIYMATAAVTDKGDGTLSVEWIVKDKEGQEISSIVFQNQYSYSGSTEVTLGASKVLCGRELKDGEFTFLLKDSNGSVVAKAVNDKTGAVTFENLSFSQPGSYEYKLSEEKGNAEYVTYDDTVYTVKITVTDSLKGYLEAEVDLGDKPLVFNNKYQKPEEPKEPEEENKTPAKTEEPKKDNKPKPAKRVKTGDETDIMLWITAGGISALILGGAAAARRRKRR
jgi:pilin isopeptide linkage protein